MDMESININNNDVHYEGLKVHQDEYVKNSGTHKDPPSVP